MKKLLFGLLCSIGIIECPALDLSYEQEVEEVVTELFDMGAIKFGSFILKNGSESPYYIDLRLAISRPQLLTRMSDLLWQKASSLSFDLLCGVPYAALALSTGISLRHNKPMIIVRKEAKEHGTRQMIEGVYAQGATALIVEDVMTSGGSIIATGQTLHDKGLTISDALVFLDREQGGPEYVQSFGIKTHSVVTITELFSILKENGRLTKDLTTPSKEAPKPFSYAKRASLAEHPLCRELFLLMEKKETNLAASADFSNQEELLAFADAVGPSICVLKIHADIIDDFNEMFIHKLQMLGQKHSFLIFEDRKFADIGNTVMKQYQGGVHKISSWAHLINAHALPGPGIIEALEKVGGSKGSGLLLIPQMSSSGALTDDFYAHKVVEMARVHKPFVVGFITQKKMSDDPHFIHFMPGIHLANKGDSLGQCYTSPHQAIYEQGADVIIVGRGLYEKGDPGELAEQYRLAGWNAYQLRM